MKGFPKFKGGFEYKKDQKQVILSLEQTQVDVAQKIPLFHLRVDVEVVDEAGKVFKSQVEFAGEEKKIVVVLNIGDSKPAQLLVDPDGKVLFSLEMEPGEDILYNTARHGRDLVNRIYAYQSLIKIGTFAALSKVKDAILQEPFHGVRAKGKSVGLL
jgi:aminopeptidase N